MNTKKTERSQGLVAKSANERSKPKKPLYISITTPKPPYYLRGAFTHLRTLADHIESESGREWLDDTDYSEISMLLRQIANSVDARRLLYAKEKSTPGRPSEFADRNLLVAYEYWIRRELSKGKKGNELADRRETALRWKDWGITEHHVKLLRLKHRKEIRQRIDSALQGRWKTSGGYGENDILMALLDGITTKRQGVWKASWKPSKNK